MTVAVAGAVLAGVCAPYLLPRDGLRPITGAVLWLSALLFRAALVWGIFAVWRTAHAVRTWLKRGSLGEGPGDSVIVGGPEVVVAAAGIRGARVVVSTGALAHLDERELTAGLEHERGHIARRHPYLTLLGSLAFALGRPLPGSRDALDRLRFCLERDADEYAVARTHDPVALASAICKAASERGAPAPTPAFAGLAGHGTAARLRLLLDRPAVRPNAWAERAGRALVVSLLALVLAAVAVTPALASAGVASIQRSNAVHAEACPD